MVGYVIENLTKEEAGYIGEKIKKNTGFKI